MSTKTFEDLIHEVHEKGICQLCGGCVSFCSSAEYDIIGFIDENSPPEYIHKDECLECGICYYICPQTHILDGDLNKDFNFTEYSNMPLGNYKNIYVCQTTDDDFLKNGIDGGVVNSIINFLIKKKKIEGAIVAKAKAAFSRKASIAQNKEDLINASGMQLDMSQHLDEIQKFSTYTYSISKLNHYKFKKLAIVGTPCQIYTIRCMQNLGVVPSQNIEVCLGLFCYENFAFNQLKVKEFEKEFKIKFKDIEKINIKEDLILKLKDKGLKDKIIHIPFDRLNEYMRSACNACNDFTNIYADISFGGLGAPEKFTTIITRTKKGDEIISNAIDAGVIKCQELSDSHRNEIKGLLSKFSQKKIERNIKFLKKIA